MIASILKIWHCSLHVCFTLLCLRFLHAVWLEVGSNLWPLVVLVVGALGLGSWKPKPALFAFTLAVPLLNGLSLIGVSGGSPMLAFAAIWLGVIARCVANKGKGAQARTNDEAAPRTANHRLRDYETKRPPAKPWNFALLSTDVLITAVLLSLGLQIWHHHNAPGFWTVFCHNTASGYGDPNYFLHSAFIWLQGLFYFRTFTKGYRLRTTAYRIETTKGEASWRQIQQTAGQETTKHKGNPLLPWVRPMFLSMIVTLTVFTAIQYRFHLPEGWTNARVQSPYEDIFSFGSMAVSAFIFTLTIQRGTTCVNLAIQVVYCTGLLGLVIASWSRGTWLAATVFLLVIAWFRLPRWCTIVALFLPIAAVVIINASAKRPSWQNNIYLVRLLALVRVENLANKSPDRLNLYRKAIDMVRERPFMGNGIGSFYLTSPSYARTGDPQGSVPTFAHNVFLQMAAELGVLVTALFASLMGCVLWRGVRMWQKSIIRARRHIFQSRQATPAQLTLLGTTLALGAYLQTNLTSNSLNIYPSNQFFFWFLMAVLLTWPHRWPDKASELDS